MKCGHKSRHECRLGTQQCVRHIMPEDTTTRVLLACARSRLDEQGTGLVRRLAVQPVDWERLARGASRHGVLALVCRNLTQAARDLIPAPTLRRLDRSYRSAGARGLALASQLAPILELLGARGIRALSFKGPALSTFLYGAPYLREFGDLDVLIAASDARRTRELLLSRGYTAAPDAARGSHLALAGAGLRIHIEVQWNLADRWGLRQSAAHAALDFEELWARRETVHLCGGAVPMLSAADAALALSVHGARHSWNRLVWLCDMAELMGWRREIDWGRVFQAASACHCRRRLLLALSLASGTLGARMPSEIEKRIGEDHAVQAAAARAQRALLSEPEADPAQECASDLDRLVFSVAVCDTPRERLRVWLEFLRRRMKPNDRDRRALRLPPQLRLAYYLVRPARLLWTYGPNTALRLLAAAAAGS